MVDRQFAQLHLAELYDLWSPAKERRDFGFYLPMVMEAHAVADIGCGTGELLRLARKAGHAGRLCGIDPAEAMLLVARHEHDVEWVLGDMTTVDWLSEFDLIVMSCHAFQVLLEDDEILRTLSAIRSALTADGRFAFETRNPAAREWEKWIPKNAVEAKGADGRTVRMSHRVHLPVLSDRVTFTTTFTCSEWPGAEQSESTLRFLDRNSLGIFLSAAGMSIVDQLGDWSGGPVSATSPEIVTIARAT
ncbi:MAG: methyltransferase domain-containing protein [Acidimicrobiales bacterium]